MKRVWRKLHRRELLFDFIMYGMLIFFGGCILLYQVIRISTEQIFFGKTVYFLIISVVITFVLNILAMVSLYRLSASYIKWYKGVLDSIPMPVIVTDKNAKWQQINKATQKIMNLKQDMDIGGLNSQHLIDDDGYVMKKTWMRGETEYRITGNRVHYEGKDIGYLIFLNNTCKTPESCETRTGLIIEINRLLGRLSTATDQFQDCASTLANYTVRQADIITELSDVIVGIASGYEPDTLNEKICIVKVDMQRHMESSQANLETIRRTVKELDIARDSLGSVIQNIDSIP